MRILAITPTFFPILGGAELLVRDVLDELAQRDEVRLLTPRLPEWSRPFWAEEEHLPPFAFEVTRFDDRLSLLDVRGHKLVRGAIPPMSLTAVSRVLAECRRFRPDLLLAFFAVPLGLPAVIAKRLTRTPLAVVLCGTDIPSPRTADVPLWRHYIRFVTGSADRAVYVSRFCFDALERRPFDPRHDAVIHGGVDEAVAGGDGAPVREALGLTPEDVLLFSLQRLGAEKRVDVTIRAFAALDRTGRRYRLAIGGQGDDEPRLRDLVRGLGLEGEVVFTGRLGDEKADWYAACDLFVFHSMFETFGQVIAEAMTAGKPVVSVRAGAIPEVVADGVTGLLVPPEDPTAMAEAVASLLDDRQRLHEMGRAARRRAEEMFAWSGRARQWQDALHLERAVRPQVRGTGAATREGEA